MTNNNVDATFGLIRGPIVLHSLIMIRDSAFSRRNDANHDLLNRCKRHKPSHNDTKTVKILKNAAIRHQTSQTDTKNVSKRHKLNKNTSKPHENSQNAAKLLVKTW